MPFATIDQVPEIEEWFWNAGNSASRPDGASKSVRPPAELCRHLLPQEPLGELSDLLRIVVPCAHEDPLFISILQLEQGKTVAAGGNRQFGWALQHKDVNLCPVGSDGRWKATGLYSKQHMVDLVR